jgi:hypothetical protein
MVQLLPLAQLLPEAQEAFTGRMSGSDNELNLAERSGIAGRAGLALRFANTALFDHKRT